MKKYSLFFLFVKIDFERGHCEIALDYCEKLNRNHAVGKVEVS